MTTQSTTGYTRDLQGNVYDAQGNHVTYESLPKGADGKPLLNLTTLPLRNTPTTTSSTSTSTSTASSNTSGYTRDAQGNVYDATGKYVTYESLPKGPDGRPIMNLETLPIGQYTGGAGTTAFDYTKAGIDKVHWDQMSPSQRALIESAWKTANNQYTAGVTNVSVNTKLLNDAMKAAETDPDIVAKYGDALKVDKANVMNSLASANAQYAQDMGLLAGQQEQDRKKLAENAAAAGQAYSGFREQAKQRLNQEQTGVISSTRRDIQKTVNDLGQGLEQKYGSGGLSQFGNLAIGYGSSDGMAGFNYQYNPLGGLTSTADTAKKADILQQGTNTYNLEKSPLS